MLYMISSMQMRRLADIICRVGPNIKQTIYKKNEVRETKEKGKERARARSESQKGKDARSKSKDSQGRKRRTTTPSKSYRPRTGASKSPSRHLYLLTNYQKGKYACKFHLIASCKHGNNCGDVHTPPCKNWLEKTYCAKGAAECLYPHFYWDKKIMSVWDPSVGENSIPLFII